MEIATTTHKLQFYIASLRHNPGFDRIKVPKVGFVPTMGALHSGHMSLMKEASRHNEIVVVSIFVNPTQFNNPDDLKKYPRMPEKDIEEINKEGLTDIVFIPAENEVYPEGAPAKDSYNFGNLETIMEGKFRPGHFKGVGQVVSRLFELVNPDNAYFGEKDFQQLAVIRELVRQKNYKINIRGCPTIRESDGLAMSSRNMLLTPEMRREAVRISRALFYVRDQGRNKSFMETKQKAIEMIESSGKLKVEYLEIADATTLQPATEWKDTPLRCLTAVQAGNIRLIDNVAL